MKKNNIFLLSVLVLIVAMATVSAADSDNNVINDNSGSDVAVDSSSSTTAQATDTSTHTDSSVDKTSDASATSSQKSDVTSQSTTQKVTEKTSENTQTTSDTTAKASSDTSSQSTQSTSQSTQQVQSDSNTTNENTNTVNEKVVDNSKSISTEDDTTSEAASGRVYNVTNNNNFILYYNNAKTGDTLNFRGNFDKLSFDIEKNITLTSDTHAKFSNTTFTFTSEASGATIQNLYFDNNEYGFEAINITSGATDITIQNNIIVLNGTSEGRGIRVDDASNINLKNNNITFNNLNTNNSYAIGIYSSSSVNMTSNTIKINNTKTVGKAIIINNSKNLNVMNNNITLSAVTTNVTYITTDNYTYEGTDDTIAIGVFNSSNTNVDGNNINISNSVASSSDQSSSTLTAIAVQGSVLFDKQISNVNITNNEINMKNDKYAYGITVHYNTNNVNVSKNKIVSDNPTGYYEAGIEVSLINNLTTINTNNITLNASSLAYGIDVLGSYLQNASKTNVNYNNITVSAQDCRNIELYFTNNTTAVYNKLYAYGNSTNGIGVGATTYSDISQNTIIVKGNVLTKSSTYDNVPFITSGIYVDTASTYDKEYKTVYGDSNYNKIRFNDIYSTGEYSINLTGNYNNITFNTVVSNVTGNKLEGNNSILVSGEGNNLTGNVGTYLEGDEGTFDDDSQTFNITQDNYQYFFLESTTDGVGNLTSGGLSDLVNDGDTLNIQGNITLTYQIAVNKAVNIISSTNDGMFVGNGSRIRLTIVEDGSNTNMTDVTLYNTELFTENAHNLTFNHINVTNIGVELGQNTGVFSMREGSSNITVTNSYFHTEDNGGHSNVVTAGATYITFDNNTVVGVGRVGNLVYLTSFDMIGNATNGHTSITNNTIIGPGASVICRAVTLSGSDVLVANNYINYTGAGVVGQFNTTEENDNTPLESTLILNNTVVGSGISVHGANVINNTADSINSYNARVVSGNTVKSALVVSGDNVTVVNNTILEDGNFNLTVSNLVIENNTMNSSVQVYITGSNNTFTNNQINGPASYNINGTNNVIVDNTGTITEEGNSTIIITGSDNIIQDNTKGENLSLNITGTNNTITNQEITGNVSYIIIGTNNVITNHEITGNGTFNITGSNNTFKNVQASGSADFVLNGTENIVANNIFNGTESILNVYGYNNIIENNTFHKVSDSITSIVYQGVIVINSDSNDNTVRYNDLYYYDGYRGTYTTGDDSVTVTEGTTGNIIQDNYGNISEVVIPTPEETNYTYITYNVTSMAELISALDNIKANGTYSNDTKYVINLLEGDYNVTDDITWGDGTSDVKDVIINGNGQIINGNGSSSTFLTINQGYSLIFNNITITNFTIEFGVMPISNSGSLNIYNSILDNVGMIFSTSSMIINNTKMSNTIIYGTSQDPIIISNSTFYDTDLSSFQTGLICNGFLIFTNNNVTNFTGEIVVGSDTTSSNSYIENNIFTDINTTEGVVYIKVNEISGVTTTLINNTFINGAEITITTTNPTNVFIVDNNYINCSLPVNITGIEDTNITTEDYTTTVTVSADSSYGANVDGKITIIINGEEYKTYDVVNGKANITIENSALNVLTNNIEIKYTSEDGSFENTTATFTITLTEDVIIRIPEGTIYSGDTIPLTTQVSVNGTIVTDGYVIFKVNGKTVRDENGNPIMVEVDENGMASLNYTIPDTYSNEYNVSIVYSGSSGIVRTNTTLTTTLKTATITVEPITAKAGQTVTLTAHITDQNGNAVSSGKLIFKLNGKTLKDADGNTLYATIVNGVATLNYTIPDNYSAKEYILTAVYQGTGFERAEANSTLTLTKSTPTIIPDSSVFGTNNTITITQGTDSVNIKATIIDPETNAPIDTTTVVTIKINDKTVTQQYVSDGQIDMTIYTSSFKNPTYNITVVVGENSQYERTSFNGTLEIVSPNGLATGSSYNGTLLVKED